jgi:hypothetical protein
MKILQTSHELLMMHDSCKMSDDKTLTLLGGSSTEYS